MGRLIKLLGLIGSLHYIFIFKYLHNIKMVQGSFVLFSTVMAIASFYTQNLDSLIFLHSLDNKLDF